jgi:hypothetical protein
MKVAGLLCLWLLAASQGQAATPTHCATNERIVFSCATPDKVVSICASGRLTQNGGSISYRFGPRGRPEISYPPPGESRDVVKAGRWVFAGGGGAWLAFHRSPFRYIVYSAVGRGWHEKAGLAVEKNGRLLMNLHCGGTPVSELGPDFFGRAGIPDDETPFDLP